MWVLGWLLFRVVLHVSVVLSLEGVKKVSMFDAKVIVLGVVCLHILFIYAVVENQIISHIYTLILTNVISYPTVQCSGA